MMSIRFEHAKTNRINTEAAAKIDQSFSPTKSSSKFKQMLLVFTVLLLTTAFVVVCTAVALNQRFHLISQRSRSNLQIEYLHGQVWVAVDAPLDRRLERLSDILEVERRKMMSSAIPYEPIEFVEKLYLDRNTYLKSLAKDVDSVITVYLEMLTDWQPNSSSNDTLKQELQGAVLNPKNFLRLQYYLWQAEPIVCEWYLDAKYRYIHSHPCIQAAMNGNTSAISKVWTPARHQPISVDFVQHQIWGGVGRMYLTYIHIIKGGSISEIGEVFGSDYRIIAPTCSSLLNLDIAGRDRPKSASSDSEVFVISQYWGESYYHVMMEDLPRLAPFLPFLRRNPQIKIHMVEPRGNTLEFLRALGIDSARLVSGQVTSDMIYLPKSTDCGNMSIFEGQLLSHEFRHYIDTQLPSNADNSNKAWKSIVLIKRSGTRHFERHDAIADVVSKLATKYGYKYELFADNPSPSATETMLMFYRARVIVAPHGAGLSNTLFARPGTFVIEGACAPLDLNYCYLMSTYHLGLIYYGVPVTGNQWGPIDIDPQHVGDVLRPILDSLGAPVA